MEPYAARYIGDFITPHADDVAARDPIMKSTDSEPSLNPIRRLPEKSIRQIRSSAAITSLNVVILGLIRNALDADAIRIDIELDSRKGYCSVEDNGTGIAPQEFGTDGGLGRMYYTSRLHTGSQETYGRNGAFLASLSALCLLTITSHHRGYRSTNSMTIHHATVVSRLLPAPVSYELNDRLCGTRVSVRDLFGNMPVRVKQRGLLHDDIFAIEKQWRSLKHQIVALILSFGRPVSIRVRELALDKVLNIKHSQTFGSKNSLSTRNPSISTGFIQSVLYQAGLVSTKLSGSWVSASASSGPVAIKGIISTSPAPSKNMQFISFSHEPLCTEEASNDIADHINKLFNRSTFGEEEPCGNDSDQVIVQEDNRRHRNDNVTRNALRKPLKGVDRWPMYYIKIRLTQPEGRESLADTVMQKAPLLQQVLEVLTALISNWLVANNFRLDPEPQKRDERRLDRDSTMLRPEVHSLYDRKRKTTESDELEPVTAGNLHESTEDELSDAHMANEVQKPLAVASFSRFSRMKSGHHIPLDSPMKDYSPHVKDTQIVNPMRSPLESPWQRNIDNFPPKSKQNDADKTHEQRDRGENVTTEDGSFIWSDPVTSGKHRLNIRTGQALPKVPPTRTSDAQPTCGGHTAPISLSQTQTEGSPQHTARWLDDMLREWKNPIFRPAEQCLQKSAIHTLPGRDLETLFTTHNRAEHAMTEASAANLLKLDKPGLSLAQVISQVDRKFILITMPGMSDPDHLMLVLVDQHAADERYQVENLFNQLVRPVPPTSTPSRSSFGHASRIEHTLLSSPLIFQINSKEAELLEAYASHFADWAIIFDIGADSSGQALQKRLTIRALPTVVAARLTLEPSLLISLLRTEVWRLTEQGGFRPRPSSVAGSVPKTNQPPPTRPPDRSSSTANREQNPASPKSHPWLRQLSTCPRGIIDLLNSRACRSAIMFNDPLNHAECADLVLGKLAKCAFPFQCAHGRPSMVPLVVLPKVVDGSSPGKCPQGEALPSLGAYVGPDAWGGSPGFWDAMSKWRDRMARSDE